MKELTDINAREFLMLGAAGRSRCCAMGIYPKPFTDVMHASVARAAQATWPCRKIADRHERDECSMN